MARDIILSRRGISFTAESVLALRRMFESAQEDNCVLNLGGVFDQHGQPNIGFGVDLTPQPVAIPDQLEDVVFYWLVEKPMLSSLRDNWCVDAEWGRKTRVIPLV